jgi:ligand-binding SRPBCC domain-containing protein
VTTGLIGLNDEVTWEARHLGIKQRLTVRITAFERPSYFQDVMVRGAFKRMIHDHSFVEAPSRTQMIDRFEFESPFGIFGWLADQLILNAYMRRFLVERNRHLKELAQSEDWRQYLGYD